MTSTVASRRRHASGIWAIRLDTTSYSTGGEDVSASVLGIEGDNVLSLQATASEPAQDSNHVYYWDRANDKLIIDVGSTGAEIAAATNVGTTELWVIAGS